MAFRWQQTTDQLSEIEKSAAERISARGGRATRSRVTVMSVLLEAAAPLDHEEISARLEARAVTHDRVTLYRNLVWLVNHGLAQRVAGGDRAAHFEACADTPHRHAHFHCQNCGRILCLEGVESSSPVVLPEGFRVERAELVLHGCCAGCDPKVSGTFGLSLGRASNADRA